MYDSIHKFYCKLLQQMHAKHGTVGLGMEQIKKKNILAYMQSLVVVRQFMIVPIKSKTIFRMLNFSLEQNK